MLKPIWVAFVAAFSFLNYVSSSETKIIGNTQILPDYHAENYNSLRFEMEKEIKMNISWLSNQQIEVLHDLKEVGKTASQLRKEVWNFYKISNGIKRLMAEKHLLKYCENLMENLLNNKTEEQWKVMANPSIFFFFKIALSAEGYSPKIQMIQMYNEASNEKNFFKILFRRECLPFIESGTEMHVFDLAMSNIHEKRIDRYLSVGFKSDNLMADKRMDRMAISLDPEKAIEIYNEKLSSDPNNTNILEKKGDALILLERFEEGIKCYEKVMELNSTKKLVLQNKKINAMLKFAEQSFENSMESIFDIHFSSNLRWLNTTQKRELRRLKAEGKKAPEILTKISEFYENSDAETKSTATDSMENGCIQVLYTIFGYEKGEELMESRLKNGTTQEFLDSLNDDGESRAMKSFLSGCQKFWFFDSETLPKVMVSLKIDGKSVQLIYDTGADVTIGTQAL